MDGKCFLKMEDDYFYDGLVPYIFPNRNENIIYISPNNFTRLKNMFIIKNEISTYGRISEGILNAYYYFFSGSSEMCSNINKWSMINFLQLRLKHLFLNIIIKIIHIFYYFGNKCMPFFKKYDIGIEMFIKNFCDDFFIKICI